MNFYTDKFNALNITDLKVMKQNNEKISCLTAYDASFSALLDQAGIDVILVGDSLGMVIQGHHTTLPVSIEDMIYHSRIVAAAKKRAFLITDMPFATYATPEQALLNAARLMQAGGAQMVKMEGCKTDEIAFLVAQGIPVCGHLGLLPQSINCLGDYIVQGKDKLQAQRIIEDALKIQQAGADLLILECVPSSLAAEISKQLVIPVIGIGAGSACDGQVLVLYDMLGISKGKRPKFSKNFMLNTNSIEDAVRLYHQAVKSIEFPNSEHSYYS